MIKKFNFFVYTEKVSNLIWMTVCFLFHRTSVNSRSLLKISMFLSTNQNHFSHPKNFMLWMFMENLLFFFNYTRTQRSWIFWSYRGGFSNAFDKKSDTPSRWSLIPENRSLYRSQSDFGHYWPSQKPFPIHPLTFLVGRKKFLGVAFLTLPRR